MSKSTLPVNPTSDMLEEESKQYFRNTLTPWSVTDLDSKTPSLDAIVEITTKESNGNHELTGKRFFAQLKARTKTSKVKNYFSVSIKRQHVLNWLSSNDRVLFFLYDVKNKVGYYQFMDKDFKASLNHYAPKWKSQQTVTVRVPKTNILDANGKNQIEKYILKAPSVSVVKITPGTFFNLKESTYELINSFANYHKTKSDGISNNYFKQLVDNTSNAIYTVAVIGPSRSGKSTLVNALMAQPISPVGKLPTTGVPFKIQPGKKDQSEILFENNKLIKGKATAEFLAQYVSQENNEDNVKKVKYVNVYIQSEQLEQGLALVDVPGLDDPSTTIRQLALAETVSADAIIYQIDVSPYSHGTFLIKDTDIEKLKMVRKRSDRLFLTVNKIDALTKKELAEVKAYITKQLTKYEVMDFLSHPPFYISADKAFKAKTSKEKDLAGVKKLEDNIWTYLLSNNKTGIHRLKEVLGNFSSELNKLNTLRNVRLFDQSERVRMEGLVKKVENELSDFSVFSENQRNNLDNWLRHEVNVSQAIILGELRSHLEETPSNENIPRKAYQNFLEERAVFIITDLYEKINDRIYELALEANQWIQKKLEQTEIKFKAFTKEEKEDVHIQQIIAPIQKNFTVQSIYSSGNALESILVGIGGLFIGFFELLGTFLTTESQRRQKKIDEVMTMAQKSYNQTFSIAYNQFKNHVRKEHSAISNQIRDRSDVYITDLKKQITKLAEPLTMEDKEKFQRELELIETTFIKMESIHNKIENVVMNIF